MKMNIKKRLAVSNFLMLLTPVAVALTVGLVFLVIILSMMNSNGFLFAEERFYDHKEDIVSMVGECLVSDQGIRRQSAGGKQQDAERKIEPRERRRPRPIDGQDLRIEEPRGAGTRQPPLSAARRIGTKTSRNYIKRIPALVFADRTPSFRAQFFRAESRMKARAAQHRRARFCGKIYISTDYTKSLPKKYNISSQKYAISSKNEYTFLTAREKYDTIWCIEIRIYIM